MKDFTDEIEIAVVVIPLLFSLPLLANRYSVYDYLLMVLIPTIYLFNYCMYPVNQVPLEEYAFRCLCLVFPYYYLGRIIDIEKFFKIFTILSAICIVMDIFYFLSYVQEAKHADEQIAGSYNMYAAYQVLPHVIMLIWASMRSFSIWKLAVAIIGVFLIISFGTRGPLACIACFTAVYFFFFMRFRYSSIVKASIIALLALAVAFIREIALWLYEYLGLMKMSTRIVEKFIMGNISNDSGRGDIKEILYERLNTDEPFWGYGLFGSQRYGIIYSHDITLDFLFSFGYFVGTLLLVVLLIVWAFVKSKNRFEREFVLFLVSVTIIKLFLSSTFLFEPLFFLMIGFCLKILLEDKCGYESSK